MNFNPSNCVLNYDSYEDIDFHLVKKNLELNSVVVIRGLVSKDEINQAVRKIKNNFA